MYIMHTGIDNRNVLSKHARDSSMRSCAMYICVPHLHYHMCRVIVRVTNLTKVLHSKCVHSHAKWIVHRFIVDKVTQQFTFMFMFTVYISSFRICVSFLSRSVSHIALLCCNSQTNIHIFFLSQFVQFFFFFVVVESVFPSQADCSQEHGAHMCVIYPLSDDDTFANATI